MHIAALCSTIYAQSDSIQTEHLEAVMVRASWADDKTPMAVQNLSKKALQQNDFGQDMPYLLQQTPSVVISSDAGTGIGYTGIRIRGTDPTRINVTINGIPYNDSESQGVYWVNINDIFGSTDAVQIQRGVGTSTSGAGAFGATINLNTNQLHSKPYGEAIASAGAFNTYRRAVRWGSGTLRGGLNFEGRWSHATSDGYVDRANADLRSHDIGVTWLHHKTSLRFNIISGDERTYQSWNGLPAQYLNTNRTYNTVGTEKAGEPYRNQVDNYFQKHFQLIYNQQISSKWSSSVALHLTRGYGYYEEYKAAQTLSKYGLPKIILTKDTIDKTDLVRRRWLNNWFWGGVYGFRYRTDRLDLTIGGGANAYRGFHYGEVIWGQFLPTKAQNDYRWYDNEGFKTDINTYVKANFSVSEKLSLYGDMQVRNVGYDFTGKDRNAKDVAQSVNFTFLNPKFGLNYLTDNGLRTYGSFAVANREPNRNDFVNTSADSRPKQEQLYDTEIGLQKRSKYWQFSLNGYYMAYKNQLALTGKINDVGEYTRINVPKSYRLGIETEASVVFGRKFSLSGNMTLSQNKVKAFTEYIDNWDTGIQSTVAHKNTNLSFSPNVITSSNIQYQPWRKGEHALTLNWIGKYVSRQYLDNTSDIIASLPAYFQQDFRANLSLENGKYGDVDFGFQINNLFNANVLSNGWTYRYEPGFNPIATDPYTIKGNREGIYNQVGYFPQAMRNITFNLRLKF